MSRVNRYRSLLLAFCTFALLLLSSANLASGLPLHHGLFAQGAAASTQRVVDDQALVHGVYDPLADDAASGVSQPNDDGDLDDQWVVPECAHVATHSLGRGVLAGNAPSLQPAPPAELLRPPRAA